MKTKSSRPTKHRTSNHSKTAVDCGCNDDNFNSNIKACQAKNNTEFNGKCGVNGCTNLAKNNLIVNKKGREYVGFVCKTHTNNHSPMDNNKELIRLWDIKTKEPVMSNVTKEDFKLHSNPINLYKSFIEWLADRITTNNSEKANVILQLQKMNNLHEIVRYMAELGLLTANKSSPFKQLDNISQGGKIKSQSMTKLRKTHKQLKRVHKRLMKRKGAGGLEVFMAIGEFFMAIINAIIKLVELIIGAVNEAAKREEERRKTEQEQAEKEQREKELNQMLYDYNNQLRDLSAKANMNVRDYILLNLKDDKSRVSDMKRTILAKAADFKMTQPEFVDYCLQIAGTNSWWYVAELLKVMKAEFDNPGIISTAVVKAPQVTNRQDSVLDNDDEFDSFDDDDEPIYANTQTLLNTKPKTINNLKNEIGKVLPVKQTKKS